MAALVEFCGKMQHTFGKCWRGGCLFYSYFVLKLFIKKSTRSTETGTSLIKRFSEENITVARTLQKKQREMTRFLIVQRTRNVTAISSEFSFKIIGVLASPTKASCRSEKMHLIYLDNCETSTVNINSSFTCSFHCRRHFLIKLLVDFCCCCFLFFCLFVCLFVLGRDGRNNGQGRMGPPGPPGKMGPKGIQ